MDVKQNFQLGDIQVRPREQLLIDQSGQPTRIAPKVMQVLCVLAEQAPEVVSRAELLERVWPGRFGADESLSKAISDLRKHLLSDSTVAAIETIPKSGYRLLIMPEEQHGDGAISSRALKRLDKLFRPPALILASIFLMLMSVAIILLDDEHAPITSKRLAMLPIVTLQDFDTHQQAAEGVLMLLADRLSSKIPYDVIPPSSSSYFEDSRISRSDVASTLNASALLRTELIDLNGKPLLRLVLTDHSNSQIVWSEDFVLGADSIKNIETSLINFLGGSKSVIRNQTEFLPNNRELDYLRALEILSVFNPHRLTEARSIFETILAEQPLHSPSKLNLAFTLIRQLNWGQIDEEIGFQRARALLAEVESKGGESSRSLMIKGFLYTPKAITSRYSDIARASTYFEQSLALDPLNTQAMFHYANWILIRTDPERAIRLLQTAQQLDPLNPDHYLGLATVRMWSGEVAESLALIEQMENFFPNFAGTDMARAWHRYWFSETTVDNQKQLALTSLECVESNPYAMDCWGFLIDVAASIGDAQLTNTLITKAKRAAPGLSAEFSLMNRLVAAEYGASMDLVESLDYNEMLPSFAQPLFLLSAAYNQDRLSQTVAKRVTDILSRPLASDTMRLYKAWWDLQHGAVQAAESSLRELSKELEKSEADTALRRLRLAEVRALQSRPEEALSQLKAMLDNCQPIKFFWDFYGVHNSPFLKSLRTHSEWESIQSGIEECQRLQRQSYPLDIKQRIEKIAIG